jgi:glyoxylase-like metal-dependent hydrolase (beta-lactamase superfamily II)
MSAVEEAGARVTGSLLTTPAPDHAAGVEGLSRRVGVPILASAGARSVLTSAIVPLVDGETIELADIRIVVRATPGIHPDHLAFEARSAGVVLVGDLVGPGPSRAIPEPVDAVALASSRALVSATGLTPLAAHPSSPA